MREGRDVLAECEASARGAGALALSLGEHLAKLFQSGKLLEVSGLVKQSDYAHERLGISAFSMYRALALARGVADKPLLRAAVRKGFVTTSCALAVESVAKGDAEASWTAAARNLPLGDLRERVALAGGDPGFDSFEGDSLLVSIEEADREQLDAAYVVSDYILGPAADLWKKTEAMGMETLGSEGALYAEVAPPEDDDELDVRPGLELLFARYELPKTDLPDDPKKLHEGALNLVRLIDGREERLGRLLKQVRDRALYRLAGCSTFAEYCSVRLGMSDRNAREHVALARKLEKWPQLRDAYRRGAISRVKAALIADEATRKTIGKLIAEAATKTWQSMKKKKDEEDDRRNRKAGKIRLTGPKESIRTIRDAVRVVCRKFGCTEGQALGVMARHFVEVWGATAADVQERLREKREEVLRRKGGLCNVPGCSCTGRHVHHIIFRSHGGGNQEWNLVLLCAAHHLRAVHTGDLIVVGEAGSKLRWTFTALGEVWETHGDDVDTKLVFDPAAL